MTQQELVVVADLLTAAKMALALIKDTWVFEHGQKNVGQAWGSLEYSIHNAETACPQLPDSLAMIETINKVR